MGYFTDFSSIVSVYANVFKLHVEAVRIWGPFKGTYLGVKRILSCHPWGRHGHDPVPQKKVN